jgi:hypothetical protein
MKLSELFPLTESPIINVELNPDSKDEKDKTWGLTPMNRQADYYGLRVMMKPSVFLSLALPLSDSNRNPSVERHIFSEPERNIASPFLDIRLPEQWFDDPPDYLRRAKVVGHEGRNRMHAWLKKHGDEPVEIHLFFRGGLRRHDITDEMIKYLQRGLHNQAGDNYVTRPFTKVLPPE